MKIENVMAERRNDYRSSDSWERGFFLFLQLPERKRFEVILGCKLKWYQKLEFSLLIAGSHYGERQTTECERMICGRAYTSNVFNMKEDV